MPAALLQNKVKPAPVPMSVPEKEEEQELREKIAEQGQVHTQFQTGSGSNISGKNGKSNALIKNHRIEDAPAFQDIPLYAIKPVLVQPKLIVNTPGDKYEQEADAIAEKVMAAGEPATTVSEAQGTSPATDTVAADVVAETNEPETESAEEQEEQGSGPTVSIQHKLTSGDDDNIIRRKELNEGTETDGSFLTGLFNAQGQPLDKSLRLKMEKRFGFDFSNVKIHTDSRAQQSARSINAAAFTWRNNIVFGKDYYQPGTRDGQRLLAHELTHVIQQSGMYGGIQPLTALQPLPVRQMIQTERIQREEALTETDKDIIKNPIIGKVTANIYQGLEFTPQDPKQTLREGSHKYIQGISGMISALAGKLYKPELVTGYIAFIGGESNITHYGDGGSIAGANEPFPGYKMLDALPGLLIEYFDKNSIPVPKEIREVIQAYYDVNQLLDMLQLSTPKWFTRPLLAFLVTSKKTWLTKFAALARKEDAGDFDVNDYSGDYYEKLETYVYFYIDIIEAIRKDSALIEEPVYAMLWDLPFNNPDAKIKIAVQKAAGDHINLENALRLIQQCNTDIADAKKAAAESDEGHKARLKLLKDAMSIPLNGSTAKANTQLSDRLNRFNAPPFPSTIRSYPPLEPPLFELVAGTSPTFSMDVEFRDFYDALGFAFAGTYGFELIRVDDALIENLIKVKEGILSDEINAKAREELQGVTKIGEDQSVRGETPTVGDVISQKVSRRIDYLEEDVDTIFKGVSGKLGMIEGMGLLSLDAVGNAFGVIGDVILSFWETISGNRWDKQIPINKPGLYIVRATAYQRDIPEDAVYVHAPSVAWMPVWARSAEDYSSKYLDFVMAGQEAAEAQLKELNEKIWTSLFMSKEERDKLIRKRNILRGLLSPSAVDQLEAKKMSIEDALAANPDEETKALLEKQKTEIERLIGIRQARVEENKSEEKGLESPFTIPTVFVSDGGPASRLTIELIQKHDPGGKYQYYVSDLTSSKKSGDTGPLMSTREEAIVEAIKKYMGQPYRYGRGYCTVSIPPVQGTKGDAVKKTFRITADGDAIVMESIDNITTAMAAILIAAAPFTEGASLALLLPLGVIGAIPSAYRLYDRHSSSSFYLDWDTAMDIVNVLSSATGVAGKVAGGLKMVTLGKGFVIVGFGLDGLGFIAGGAMTLEEIDNISKRQDLSPGAKRAMIMMAVGGQLANIGLAIGSRVFEAGQLMEKSATQEGNMGSQKLPVQDNIPPAGKGDAPPVKINDGDVVKPPALPNEPDIQTPKTTAPVTPADPVPVSPDTTTPAKPPVMNEPDVQTPKPPAPVTPADPVPVSPDTTTPAKPPVTNEPDVQTPKTPAPVTPEDTTPVTPADPVPVSPDTTTPAKPPVTNEPDVQTPKTPAPEKPAEPAPITPDTTTQVKPPVTNEPEAQTPKTSAPVTPAEPAPATPDKTTTKTPGADETPAKPVQDENVPPKKEGENTVEKPDTEEAAPKEPTAEENKPADGEESGQAAKPTPDENSLDYKIAAAEAALSAAKEKQRKIAARMQELNKIVEDEPVKRKELLERHAKSNDPAERKALMDEARESKKRQDKAVEQYNKLFEKSGTLRMDVGDLEKKLKGLKDNKADRLQDDIDVDPTPPAANDGVGNIGTTPNQDMQLLADVQAAKASDAKDIRVNQQQVDASGKRVGTNRPDLQYTLNGQRYYIEYEHPNNPRGDEHTKRILANDQKGIVQVKLVPDTPGFIPGKGVVILTKP